MERHALSADTGENSRKGSWAMHLMHPVNMPVPAGMFINLPAGTGMFTNGVNVVVGGGQTGFLFVLVTSMHHPSRDPSACLYDHRNLVLFCSIIHTVYHLSEPAAVASN